ncbi:uncharacterized protein, partial [Amphiura filiformis]|uniref:uncharacterized protein n=1 Tax=Amphiura filiformis TaxID=82378 RepID=UPI003B20DB4F
FGNYAGCTFKWLLENDVGWRVWLLDEFKRKGETSPRLKWQKEHLLNLKENREKRKSAKETLSFLVILMILKMEELLAAADDAPSSNASQEEQAGSSSQTGDSTVLEGWQMSWEQGMYAPNISWLKSDGPYGILESARSYTTAKGTIGTRQIFKKRMEFSPPPLTTTMGGTLPPMLSFFTTPALFWRPVGVMDVKIRCPNAKCPAPPDTFLNKLSYGSVARQVCGMRYNYTLLTERLRCNDCLRLCRQQDS